MASFPVLDDATRDAMIIGNAGTPEAAAAVWVAYMAERTDEDDRPAPPTFVWRNPHDASFREIADAEISKGFFEPLA